jgi:hypothetical protein
VLAAVVFTQGKWLENATETMPIVLASFHITTMLDGQ